MTAINLQEVVDSQAALKVGIQLLNCLFWLGNKPFVRQMQVRNPVFLHKVKDRFFYRPLVSASATDSFGSAV